MAIKDLKESLANNTKQLDGIRASTKSMSKGIETLVKLQTADRKQKYEEARDSIRDKQKQEKLTAAKVAREKSDGTGGKGLLSGIGGLFKNLKLFDWAKWFGIIGLGILFEKEIKGVFSYIKGKVKDYWDNTLGKALEKFARSITPEWMKSFIFGEDTEDPISGVFSGSSKTGLQKSWEALTSALSGIASWFKGVDDWVGKQLGMEQGPFATAWDSVTTYLKSFSTAFGTLMRDIGITKEDGSFSTGAKFGLGALVALLGAGGLLVTVISKFAALALIPLKVAGYAWNVAFGMGRFGLGGAWKLARAALIGIGLMKAPALTGAGTAAATGAAGSLAAGLGGTGFAAGAERMIGQGANKQRIVMGPGGTWHAFDKTAKGNLGRQVTRGMLDPSLNAAGRGGHLYAKSGAVAAASRSASMRAAFAGGALRFMGAAMTHPLVLGATALAALFGAAWYYADKETEKRKSDAKQAIANKTIPQAELDEAELDAKRAVREPSAGRKLLAKLPGISKPKTQGDFSAEGRQGFMNWLAYEDKTEAKQGGAAWQKADYEAQQKEFKAAQAEQKKDEEDFVLETVGALVVSKRREQRAILNSLLRGPLYMAIRSGAIELEGTGDDRTKAMKLRGRITAWLEKKENKGRDISMAVLNDWGLKVVTGRKFKFSPNVARINQQTGQLGRTGLQEAEFTTMPKNLRELSAMTIGMRPGGYTAIKRQQQLEDQRATEEAGRTWSLESGLGSVRSTSQKDKKVSQADLLSKQVYNRDPVSINAGGDNMTHVLLDRLIGTTAEQNKLLAGLGGTGSSTMQLGNNEAKKKYLLDQILLGASM